MKKIIYIIAGILVVVSIVLVVLFRNKTAAPSTSQPSTASTQIPNLPSAAELKDQGKAAVPSASSGGQSVVINDPYKDALKVVSGNADMKKTPDYEIVYLGDSKSFVITLSGSNLADARNKAEQAFLDTLGINKTDACQLVVSMGVDPSANPDAAGRNYGLSFCPSGKPLPGN